MTWHNKPGIAPFDVQPTVAKPVGWYRFTAPPGLRAMTAVVHGTPQAWVNGREAKAEEVRRLKDGSAEYRIVAAKPASKPATVALRIEQRHGYYGGAAIPEPITLDCGKGLMSVGDWSKWDRSNATPAAAWYRKTVFLPPKRPNDRVRLDLGSVVATAEVHVNGQIAGIKVAPPWLVDISKLVKPGENRIEILVYNTLANHYQTIPTPFRGVPTSGLLTPVRIHTARMVELR